jgi:biotin-(acetyl-CoA carboxylase) ligase
MVIGRDIEYIRDGDRYTARAVDIDEDGSLIVEDARGHCTALSSGEITVRPKA